MSFFCCLFFSFSLKIECICQKYCYHTLVPSFFGWIHRMVTELGITFQSLYEDTFLAYDCLFSCLLESYLEELPGLMANSFSHYSNYIIPSFPITRETNIHALKELQRHDGYTRESPGVKATVCFS